MAEQSVLTSNDIVAAGGDTAVRTDLTNYRLSMSLLENRYAIRDLESFLLGIGRTMSGARPTANSLFTISASGDSVAGLFGVALFRWMIANGWKDGGRQFGTPDLAGAVTTTGTFAYRGDLVGPVTDQTSFEGTWNFKYLRNASHIEMNDGATYEMDCGQSSAYDQVGVWLAKGVAGSGACQIDVINRDTSAIIQTVTVAAADLAAGSLDRLRTLVNLGGIPKVRVRLTAIGGPVVFLAMFLLRSTGGIVLDQLGSQGGSTLEQQNYANQTIFAGMCADLGTKAFMLHCKEERGGDLYAPTMAKLTAVAGTSVIAIGSFPDSSAEALQLAANAKMRTAALALPTRACYFDGYRACINFAESKRLGWFLGNEGTHPELIMYQYILVQLLSELGILGMPRLFMSTPVDALTVTGGTLSVRAAGASSPTDGASPGSTLPALVPNIEFAAAFGGGGPTYAALYNIRDIWMGPRGVITSPRISVFGTAAVTFRNGTDTDEVAIRAKSILLTGADTASDIAGTMRFAKPPQSPSYTVANLPNASAGATAFATNARRTGEAAGSGTGRMAMHMGTSGWKDTNGDTLTV